MLNALTNVGFWGQSGHDADTEQCRLMTLPGISDPRTDLAPIVLAPYIWSAAPAEASGERGSRERREFAPDHVVKVASGRRG